MGIGAWHDASGGLGLKCDDGEIVIAGPCHPSERIYMDGRGNLYAAGIDSSMLEESGPDGYEIRIPDGGSSDGYGRIEIPRGNEYDMGGWKSAVLLGGAGDTADYHIIGPDGERVDKPAPWTAIADALDSELERLEAGKSASGPATAMDRLKAAMGQDEEELDMFGGEELGF